MQKHFLHALVPSTSLRECENAANVEFASRARGRASSARSHVALAQRQNVKKFAEIVKMPSIDNLNGPMTFVRTSCKSFNGLDCSGTLPETPPKQPEAKVGFGPFLSVQEPRLTLLNVNK